MKCYQNLQIWILKMEKLVIFHWFYNVFRVLINHDLDRFRATPERRISVDYGSRSNIVKQMVSAQICPLAAPLWAQVIDFIWFLQRLCAPWNPPESESSRRRILNVNVWFKSPVEVTILLGQHQNHHKNYGNITKPIADASSQMCIFSTICGRRSNIAKQVEINQHDHLETSKNI